MALKGEHMREQMSLLHAETLSEVKSTYSILQGQLGYMEPS